MAANMAAEKIIVIHQAPDKIKTQFITETNMFVWMRNTLNTHLRCYHNNIYPKSNMDTKITNNYISGCKPSATAKQIGIPYTSLFLAVVIWFYQL